MKETSWDWKHIGEELLNVEQKDTPNLFVQGVKNAMHQIGIYEDLSLNMHLFKNILWLFLSNRVAPSISNWLYIELYLLSTCGHL